MEKIMLGFRPMDSSDVSAAFEVRTSTIENKLTMEELEEYFELTPETLIAAMQSTAKGWVCEDGGRIVGFAMGDSEGAELTVIAVLPDYEGLGIGKKLIQEVEDWLFSLGHCELWLLTTPDPTLRAYKFYLSRGWVATGKIVDEDEKFVLRETR